MEAFPTRAMCSGLLVLSLVTQSHLITVHGVLETTRLFKALGVLAPGQGCGEWHRVLISRGLCGLLEGTVQSCGCI